MDDLTKTLKKVEDGFWGQKMLIVPPDFTRAVINKHLMTGLYLTAIGYFPQAAHHYCERKSGIPEYILLYCVEGRGYVSFDQTKYELEPNSYIIVPQGSAHHYTSSLSNPWSIYWVHFSGNYADALFSRHLNDGQLIVGFIPYNEQRIELFNFIFSTIENSYSARSLELANIKLLQFLASFIYHEEIDPSFDATDQIGNSITLMKENLSGSFTIHELAAKANYSISHYSDLFKRKTGSSPIQYFNQLKVQKSCQYLYFTDLNIKEICVKIGFEDPYYFSRMFKKLMKISPDKYRNTHRIARKSS